MKLSLTIAFVTAREHPCFEWFTDSLLPQIPTGAQIDVIRVDHYCREPEKGYHLMGEKGGIVFVQRVPPKPNVWSGPHRLTPQDCWSKASDLNTAICLCTTDWISFIDDRCVLGSKSLVAIQDAMVGGYAVCGSYEKRIGMQVVNGKITVDGQVIGRDPRNPNNQIREPQTTFGAGWFGCCNALPLEWCLKVNGFPEICDGMRYEDTSFGHLLGRNGLGAAFDPRLMVMQDRTGGNPTPLGKDKGQSPRDKSHALLEKMGDSKISLNPFDIRAMRNNVLAGQAFPIPTEPKTDWYDGQLLSEMVMP